MLPAENRPPDDVFTLEREAVVAAPLDATFDFFSNAANLERLTPPWLNFRILSPLPGAIGEGTIIDYQIRLYGVPIPWRTRIDVWEPGRRFVDRQLAGPYRWWHHEHRFESVGLGTRVIDVVRYRPRAARLSGALVKRDVNRIFAFRAAELPRLLEVCANAD